MRIVVDLDGTICAIKKPNETYDQVLPLPGVVETLNKLRAEGHYIIIQTARNMATQQANIGKVMKNVGKITLEWLDKHQIIYDEIHFGKPNADVYIDDRCFRFSSWNEISTETLTAAAKDR